MLTGTKEVVSDGANAVAEGAMLPDQPAVIIGLAVILGLVHVGASEIKMIRETNRKWLSVASGVAVAYVFMDILPEIHEAGSILEEGSSSLFVLLGKHIYGLSLVGFLLFYGLEHYILWRRNQSAEPLFKIHVGLFVVYNVVVGYVLAHLHVFGDPHSLGVFTFALGLHFGVNDYNLRLHHQQLYEGYARWFLAAGVILGAGLGLLVEIDLDAALVIAFLAGGIVLFALKHELADPDTARPSYFIGAALLYGTVLLLV